MSIPQEEIALDPNDPRALPRPLFICGNARGGTTLLVRLLDGHPELLVLPTETQIFPSLATRLLARWLLRIAEFVPYRRAVELLARPAVARVAFRSRPALAARLRLWAREYPSAHSLADATIDAAAMEVDEPHQYWNAFLRVFSQFTGVVPAGKRYWVEKTPGAERFAGVSDIWCGRTGQFLHVIRDPRDVIASTLVRGQRLGMEGSRAQKIVRLCFTWSQSIGWCHHGTQTIVGRYHVLRHEDLVTDPHPILNAVCALIEIPMHADLLKPTRLGEPVRLNSSDLMAAGLPGQIVDSRVGRFRADLSLDEIHLIEELLSAQMKACGYDLLTDPTFSICAAFNRLEPIGYRDLRTRLLTFTVARAQAVWRGRTLPRIAGAKGSS